jgi:hypothetical protein
MTTVQESTNGHHHSPLPCSAENPADLNSAGLPTNQDDNHQLPSDDQVPQSQNGSFPAGAYHVPPKLYAPKADSFRDTIPDGLSTMKLPDRCQFMFSDGRQCTMARSDIHPSLCFYHADREEQLFGDPSYRCETRKLDFPELFSACRDLSTAAGVNRALAQVFRLLAQRRISRQEAATFAKLGHLLLQSIRAARAELLDALPDDPAQDEDSGVILSESASADESHGHQELSSVNKVESKDPSAPGTPTAPAASSEPLPAPPATRSSFRMNTSAASRHNSPEINTYENTPFNPIQNQYLHKNAGAAQPHQTGPR